jgi:hypothetical protein
VEHVEQSRVLSLEPADASDTWLGWLCDPEVMSPLNSLPWNMTHQELEDYISEILRPPPEVLATLT